jgi:hypothetical protein
MTHHRLKATPEWYAAYAADLKPWSMRNNDRQFQPDDTVTFYEWDGVKATGDETGPFHIMSVWRHLDWLPKGHVMMSIQRIAPPIRRLHRETENESE